MRRWLIISLILNVVLAIAFLFLIKRLGGWRYSIYWLRNRGIATAYENRKNLFEILPKTMQQTIVFLGDSITAACEWSELLANPKVINRGIAGDMVDGVEKRLNEVLLTSPSKIFLMIGVNDLIFKSPQTIASNYENLVQTILQKSPHAQLYLQSVLPVNNEVRFTGIENKKIQELNQLIQHIAEKHKVDFINLYPLFLDKNGNLNAEFTLDGIHLQGSAYLIWKEAIAPYIEQQ